MFLNPRFNRMLITWFGAGNIKFAPGTFGSLFALPLCWCAAQYFEFPLKACLLLGFTSLAILCSAQDQIQTNNRDPGYIVIDEVAGMLAATFLLTPNSSIWAYGCAFVLFRIFDIWKPYPASVIDRASKTASTTLRRGAAIVLDDSMAGIYAALVLFLLKVK